MASRRSHGTGSLVERPAGSGKWFFRYVTGRDPLTGKLRRRAITITAKNKSAAQAKAQKILASLDDISTGSSATVTQLLQEWMRFQDSRGRSPTTLNGYRSVNLHHIDPAIGNVRLCDLSAHQLDSLYRKITSAGSSPRTVRNIHNVISAACNQAVKWSWMEVNPALRATLPEARSRKLSAPNILQTQKIITVCQERDESLGAFVFLAAVTGCRRGEVAAFRWSSVHDGMLDVTESVYSTRGVVGIKSTKSGRERIIHVDPLVSEWLKTWHTRCVAQAHEWEVELTANSFIVSSRPDGSTPINLDSMSRGVRHVANSLGLPTIHLHSLRHFAATELLAAGVTANDAAEMLGHADPSLTLRIYAHSSFERQRTAAGILANALVSHGTEIAKKIS